MAPGANLPKSSEASKAIRKRLTRGLDFRASQCHLPSTIVSATQTFFMRVGSCGAERRLLQGDSIKRQATVSRADSRVTPFDTFDAKGDARRGTRNDEDK